jgi:hypothetical protein
MYKVAGTVAAVAALVVAAPALASHGGGGGGGTPTPTPTPTGTPAVSISPSSVDFGSQALGTTSAPQTITITDTGTAPVFFNSTQQQGLDFNRTADECVGVQIAPGAACTITVVFQPTVTGPRSATITVVDNAADSPQTITLTGTGTSVDGPTPLTVDTTGSTCTGGVCALGSSPIVNNFLYRTFGADGEFTTPLTWTVDAGTLPDGTSLNSDGALSGYPAMTGTSTFTLRVTDAAGRTAAQAFSLTVSPVPPAGDPSCQKAPSESSTLTATGSVNGVTPSGQAPIDVSHFTACGGYYVINASVKDVNLPDGTVLWVALSGQPIGTIALSRGAGSMRPYVWPSELRRLQVQVFTSPPPFGAPILTGPQLI